MEYPKVLYLVDQLGRGGAAQVVMHAALSLDRYSPIVCTTRAVPADGRDELLRSAGITLIQLNRRSRLGFLEWRKLWQVLPSVSILHSHESGSNFWGRVWGQLFRVPVIITQDHTAADEKGPIVHLADRILSRLSDLIITVSDFDRDLSIRHERLPPEKVVTVYNGIDPTRFDLALTQPQARVRAGLPSDDLVIAVIARLVEQKSHNVLFEALQLLPDDMKAGIQCLVIGSGPLEHDLKAAAHAQGLGDRVSFLGERSDIPTILRAIDLLVLPSRWECLPMIILEALAAGAPIVSTSVGGVPEVLGQLDWPLVEAGDPFALAEAITRVVHMSEEERSKNVREGRNLIEQRFGREKAVLQIQELYDSLLSNR